MRISRWAVALTAVLALAGCAGGQVPEPGGEPSGSGPTTSGTTTEPPTSPASPTAEPTSTPSSSDDGTSLTITLDETGLGTTRTFMLTCDPPGGDHPDPDAACAALAAAGGADAFVAPPRDEMCTEIYGGPQVATVEGTVDGTRVRARFSRTNGCEISRWDALAPLLGSAGGA
ncbi:SSI family serine proteinase inhibitor [Cellulomonas sp. KRMCY2]|uniref:SSI family serine proteinase inhibitor n=1 Tax=Cellulomonas sp. KRMCY2 TaxID=1304865 RepID=UPI00045E8486|nr:SSI family serine proteinase inhibitor [Cellulomonas sp. KRMCY2]